MSDGVFGVDFKGKKIGEWYNPYANKAFIESLIVNINSSKVKVVEVDAHINDDVFAERLINVFKGLMH